MNPREPQQVRYRIKHATTYRYEDPVSISLNEARLSPREDALQSVQGTRFVVDPAPAFMSRQSDYFGNLVHRFALQDPHRTFSLTTVSEVTVLARPALDPAASPPWESVRDRLRTSLEPADFDALSYCFESDHVVLDPRLEAYARESFSRQRPILEAALELNHRVFEDYTYDPEATVVATPLSEVVDNKRGVCQDFAHLMLACLRPLGLSARYVSGYLRTTPPPGETAPVGADASHAWVAIYVPELGFVGLDPTNDKPTGTDHTVVAWGRDYADVSPLRGVVLGGGAHSVAVQVEVTPLEG